MCTSNGGFLCSNSASYGDAYLVVLSDSVRFEVRVRFEVTAAGKAASMQPSKTSRNCKAYISKVFSLALRDSA